jgi:phosphoribosylformimino-5-aminoimidazole carboxamide ribotide isomerase
MDIIPAIDILDGKCVRLCQGDYEKKIIYNEDPLEVAKMFEDWGINRLHLVDLDGAKASHIVNYPVLYNISTSTSLEIDFGGGLKSNEDLRVAFENGASMITGGSIAVTNPDIFLSWLEIYGAEKIILGADHRKGKIAISGWTQESEIELFDIIEKYQKTGINKLICTDIEKDGMLEGPSIDMYKDILKNFPGIYLVASGGVGDVNDLIELEKSGLPAVIIGKAIYEGRITELELKRFLI